jgi:2-amino-4-hydroxy-6-hydroxymethyldihydropteridine diphosphokinase
MKEIVIASLDELKDVAEAVVESLEGRNVVALFGAMGAGKTTLISAIMEHLGSTDNVTSPTFALVNQYNTAANEPVYHFDFYRINRIEEGLGRNREKEREISAARGERYASRPIDIDIVFYGDETFDDDRLTIPYHYLAEREYALLPVAEIAPERKHPALERTPREMLEAR